MFERNDDVLSMICLTFDLKRIQNKMLALLNLKANFHLNFHFKCKIVT